MSKSNHFSYSGFVKAHSTIRDAIGVMANNDWKLCIVVDDDDYAVGVFTEGDYRKLLIKGHNLDTQMSEVANKKYVYVDQDYSEEKVVAIFSSSFFEELPVLENGKVIDILYSEDFVYRRVQKDATPVIIMAGGKGTRLDPFTRILPKPLIPIGQEPVVRVIMDRFVSDGFSEFIFSLNDKAEIIESYFSTIRRNYNIDFFKEEKAMGTAGSLSLLKDKIEDKCFVSNCDIITKVRNDKLLNFHSSNNFDFTIVAATQNHQINYGVCNFDSHGQFININEKPCYENLVVTGLYVLSKNVLELIPKGIKFDMPDLIEKAKENGLKVGVFPLPEDCWYDVGQWDEFNKIIDRQ